MCGKRKKERRGRAEAINKERKVNKKNDEVKVKE